MPKAWGTPGKNLNRETGGSLRVRIKKKTFTECPVWAWALHTLNSQESSKPSKWFLCRLTFREPPTWGNKCLNIGIWEEKKALWGLNSLGEVSPGRETPDEGRKVAGNLGRITLGDGSHVQGRDVPPCGLFRQNMLGDPFWSRRGMF